MNTTSFPHPKHQPISAEAGRAVATLEALARYVRVDDQQGLADLYGRLERQGAKRSPAAGPRWTPIAAAGMTVALLLLLSTIPTGLSDPAATPAPEPSPAVGQTAGVPDHGDPNPSVSRSAAVRIPNLHGLSPTQAEQALRAVGLVPVTTSAATGDEAMLGRVVAQRPAPTAWVTSGGTVLISVGAEPDAVTVPAVIGLARAEARQALAAAGLTVGGEAPVDEAG
ncbi:MAG: hypothetical protein QOE58_523, partial [Actinomycetota bacterium]|nr:hypothetical protein [Actinomycetota bacterium]